MNKKIECLKRLIELDRLHEMIEWLINAKFIKANELDSLKRNQEIAEFIYAVLRRAELDEKLTLLHYEWSILPLETIKITCISEVEKKEFSYRR